MAEARCVSHLAFIERWYAVVHSGALALITDPPAGPAHTPHTARSRTRYTDALPTIWSLPSHDTTWVQPLAHNIRSVRVFTTPSLLYSFILLFSDGELKTPLLAGSRRASDHLRRLRWRRSRQQETLYADRLDPGYYRHEASRAIPCRATTSWSGDGIFDLHA